MSATTHCPGCGGAELGATVRLPNQPVVLNYRFTSVEEARRVPRRDVTLVQCAACGLVFNSSFDPSVIPYDERYENRQCFSPAFQDYLEQMARDLTERHGLRGGRILEVGCGKGDFLRLICRLAAAQGTGYDTTYEGPEAEEGRAVRFVRQYVTAAQVTGRFDAVICRHVIEHVPNIGEFLRELSAVARAAGGPVVVLETPSFEWIVEHGCFWDVFYEHCNYFTLPTLAFLAERAGFRLERHSVVFGGQYQLLELRFAGEPAVCPKSPGTPAGGELARFAEAVTTARQNLEARLCEAGAERGWAIWGAGAKGVALVSQLTIAPPRFLVDANPAKQGCVVPASSVPVISPDDPRVLDVPVILVANPNYLDEIKAALAAKGFRHTLVST
ncbi:MAG: methyltransferase domain-containing protein [Verrucomicrobia bacterium]|nr:methyltransferase domain-containing protein [Verrucomicrobiota bacterium]